MMTPADRPTGSVTSFDGSVLATRDLGSPGATPVLLVPSVGSNLAPWRRSLAELVDTHRVITWDLRGLHSSQAAATPSFDPASHAEDAIAVMDEAGIDRAPVLAWSTGGRIALELAAAHPDRVSGLFLVNGMNGYPLSRLIRHLDIPVVLPVLAGLGKHFPTIVGGALRAVVGRPELGGIVRQSGLLAPTADVAAFVDMLKGLAECDPKALLHNYEAVAGADDPEILAGVSCPTSLVVAERDPFTPRGLTEQIVETIPGASVSQYERATHFLPLEFPSRLARDIAGFLATL